MTKNEFRFLHVSDTHLGYRQYNSPERMKDFHHSFKECLQHGVAENVNAVLVSGDFFDERNVPPEAFLHAKDALDVTKNAGIPVFMILGNHDAPWRVDRYSWPQVLQDLGYVQILEPEYGEDGSYSFQPYNPKTKNGGYVDATSYVRIYGVPFQGYRIRQDFPAIAKAIDNMLFAVTPCGAWRASMGPRPCGRGNFPQIRQRPFSSLASMGPRPCGRGNW